MTSHQWFPLSCGILGGKKTLPSFRSSAMNPLHTLTATASSRVRIAIVGDVHDDWDPVKDAKALQVLKPDLVLFTGDFGDGNVELVRQVSHVEFPKAVILGNHDCWFTHQSRSSDLDPVQQQLESLGEAHVGYSRLDFPLLQLSVVGGRPFSAGGPSIGSANKIISKRYGVKNMQQSARRIFEVAIKAPSNHALVFLAHDGPTGLGSDFHDICGKDFDRDAGDHGDPDLEEAIRLVKEHSSHHEVPLVAFGHMHHTLLFGGFRNMVVADGEGNTVYVNAAYVPRVRPPLDAGISECEDTDRNFTIVEIYNKRVEKVETVWIRIGGNDRIVKSETLFSSSQSEAPSLNAS